MTASRTADLNDAAAFAAARKRLDERPEVPGTVRAHVLDDGRSTPARLQLERRLNDIGWGLLLMLTGVVWLLPTAVPPGTWLFGVAAILIGINVLRFLKHLALSGFSLTLGAVALAAAVSQARQTEAPLVAISLLAIGASIVVRAAWGKAQR